MFDFTESSSTCVDELTSLFDTVCCFILDTVALLKTSHTKYKRMPWMNEITHAARSKCRKPECKWKKDGLHVSFEIYNNCLRNYQRVVKPEKN